MQIDALAEVAGQRGNAARMRERSPRTRPVHPQRRAIEMSAAARRT
jgi:hypothetical protein